MLNNHITKPTGKNAPGVGFELYACPIKDFTLIAEPPDTETTPGEDIVITDDHTFTGGKGFRKIYTTPRSGEVNHTQAGDIDSMGMNGEFNGFSPGINEALFSLLSKDEDLIVLVKDSNCSTARYWQLGTSCLPAKIMGSESAGRVSVAASSHSRAT